MAEIVEATKISQLLLHPWHIHESKHIVFVISVYSFNM
jgi:hypothetical protein